MSSLPSFLTSGLRGLAAGAAALVSIALPASAQFVSARDMPPAVEVDAGNAVVSLVAEDATVAPGETFTAAIRLDIDPHWHVYWINAGDSGLPTEIEWLDTTNAVPGGFSWPAPHEQPLDGLMNYGYEDELILPFPVEVPADASGTVTLRGVASYLICMDICVPEEAHLILEIPVGDTTTPDPDGTAIIERGESRLPLPLDGTAVIDRSGKSWTLSLAGPSAQALKGASHIRYFPLDHQIEHPPIQPVREGAEGLSLTLTPAHGFEKDGAMEGVVVGEFADGTRKAFSLTAEPGKTLAGTANTPSSANTSAPGGSGEGSALPGSGGAGGVNGTPINLFVVLGLALLGGAILNLMPCVLPVLSIKAMGLAQAASGGHAAEVRRHGMAYFAGVIASMLVLGAVIVALKGAGEAVGIGVQLQYPPVVAAFALIIFLIGLNLFGLFEVGGSLIGAGDSLTRKEGLTGAFFTGVLAAVLGAPCIGPFLGAASGWALNQNAAVILTFFLVLGIGLALPFTLISFVPGLRSLLPKPGQWMVRLRQFFAFPMFLTAAWLIWVLAMGQGGAQAVAATLVAGVLIVFAIWLFQSAGGKLRAAALALGAVSLITGVSAAAFGTQTSNVDMEVVEWSPQARDAALADGQGVFVDFTAAWCVTCQANKLSTLRTAKVQKAFLANEIVFMEADWTDKNAEIAEELSRYGRAGVPLYLYYPPGDAEPVILNQLLSPGYVIKVIQDPGRA